MTDLSRWPAVLTEPDPALVWSLVVAGLVAWVWMAVEGRIMTATGGPGIVPYELARSEERSSAILDVWGPEGRTAAVHSLLVDYVFIVAYAGLIIVVCLSLGAALDGRTSTPTQIAAAAAPVAAIIAISAGVLDAVENAALLWQLEVRPARVAAAVAFLTATAKFALVGIALLYIPVAAGLWLLLA
jgi:hypothetical protein